MRYAIYTGDRLDVQGRPLKGKRALIARLLLYQVRASFDDQTTGCHFPEEEQLFPAEDWEIIEAKVRRDEDFFVELIKVTVGGIQLHIDDHLGRLCEAMIKDAIRRERINELMRESERREQQENNDEA